MELLWHCLEIFGTSSHIDLAVNVQKMSEHLWLCEEENLTHLSMEKLACVKLVQ